MLYRFSISILVFGMLMGVAPTDASALEAEWQQLINGTSIGQVWALEGSADRLYAGSSEGVFRSENNGQTWVRIGFDTQDPFDNSVAALTVDRNSVYVGTWSSGLFRSDDAGETWKRINDGLWRQHSDETVIYGTARGFLIIDDTLINVMYHAGTYTSTDRGETWINVSEKWEQGDSIYNMTFFDGYLWSAISHVWMARSADKGETWQHLPLFEGGFTCDWAVFEGQLYAAADEGVGRWNETTQIWEYPMDGLPIGSAWDPNDPPWVWSFAVRGGRLFAGLETHGVYIFNADAERWSPAGLEGFSVYSLLSHTDALYAGTDENGIYRLEIPDVLTTTAIQPQGKALTTWAGMKQPLD